MNSPANRSVLGEQIHRLRTGPAGVRETPDEISIAPGEIGNVLYGPYVSLPPGAYWLRLRVEAAPEDAIGSDPKLLLEAVFGRRVVKRMRVDGALAESQSAYVDFVVTKSAAAAGPFEVRLGSGGRTALTITSVYLGRQQPDTAPNRVPAAQRGPFRFLKRIFGPTSTPGALNVEGEIGRLQDTMMELNSNVSTFSSRLEELDQIWSQHAPALLNAVTSVNQFGYQLVALRKEIEELRSELDALRNKSASGQSPQKSGALDD